MTAQVGGRRRRWRALGLSLVLFAGVVTAGYWLHQARIDVERALRFDVGDCVVVPSSARLHASKAPCAVDPSYTVGALADGSGSCPSTDYQRFDPAFADPATASLCLVPNLVVNHCYELQLPIGMVDRVDCARRGSGVLVQVTQRFDARDEHACPAAPGRFAWPYPAPARTYCTTTLF